MSPLFPRIQSIQYLGGHILQIQFEDETGGTWDASQFLQFDGVFAPLKNPQYFATATIHPEFGTIAWGQDFEVDIAPETLYCWVNKLPLPSYNQPEAS